MVISVLKIGIKNIGIIEVVVFGSFMYFLINRYV